eukprot:6183771-Pleurochrysis_carterae.AAC.2
MLPIERMRCRAGADRKTTLSELNNAQSIKWAGADGNGPSGTRTLSAPPCGLVAASYRTDASTYRLCLCVQNRIHCRETGLKLSVGIGL